MSDTYNHTIDIKWYKSQGHMMRAINKRYGDAIEAPIIANAPKTLTIFPFVSHWISHQGQRGQHVSFYIYDPVDGHKLRQLPQSLIIGYYNLISPEQVDKAGNRSRPIKSANVTKLRLAQNPRIYL